MAPAARSSTERPSDRAALAREKLNVLPENEIVYVDRLGPRILRVPPKPTAPLSRETLRELNKGHLSGDLGRGTRFLAQRMIQCPEITIDTNGQYTVLKTKKNSDGRDPRPSTIRTLDVWTGKPGQLYEDRNIDDLVFYSVRADLLPSYHSWRDDKFVRRESSLELEKEIAENLAEQNSTGSPTPIEDAIDEGKEEHQARIDEAASNEPENMLRYRPDIGPSDPAWEGAEEYFKWVLQWEREANPEIPHTHRILQEELEESQQLLAIPAINSGYRAKIQDENTKYYHAALSSTFQGKPDNLATKLTMLCFGLPIEPLTIANVKFAGGPRDKPVKDIEDEVGPKFQGEIVEHLQWSEKPLEFLDYYNERSYGYPMLRTQKRKYEEVDAEAVEKLFAQAQKRAKIPQLVRDICGFPEMSRSEWGLHMRGGAGNPVELQPRRVWIHTDNGRFLVDDSFQAFHDFAYRLLRLDFIPRWWCQVDLIPVVNTGSGVELNPKVLPRQCIWDKEYRYQIGLFNYDLLMLPKRKVADRWIIRMRYVGIVSQSPPMLDPSDPWEPLDYQNLVNLEVDGVGTAYWYLPTNPVGINQYQDTFRNAVECLIPNHRQFCVKWTLSQKPSASGQLQLIAEAPSKALWEATQKALKPGRRVTIHLQVVQDKPSPLSVKILMPGFNSVAWYNRLPDEDLSRNNLRIFEVIRKFGQQRTESQPTPLRIWSGPENYTSDDDPSSPLSMVLTAKQSRAGDLDVWINEGLAYTPDAVVVRREVVEYYILDVTNGGMQVVSNIVLRSVALAPRHGHITLQQFRSGVSHLWSDFDPCQEYFGIEQSQSGHNFIVGPEMTEIQWRLQVFDWLDSPRIHVRRHTGNALGYSKDPIDGPLGRTSKEITASSMIPVSPEIATTTGAEKVLSIPQNNTQPSTTELGTTKQGTVQSGTTQQGIIRQETTRHGITQVQDVPLDDRLLSESREAWDSYQHEQHGIEQRRIEAYGVDHSVYRDGQDPEIPRFGPAFEPYIPVVGTRFPVVFTQMRTPTEAVKASEISRHMQNIILDRQDFCPVCDTALGAGPHNLEDRIRHFQGHKDALKEARRNALGNFATVAQQPAREVFYCECCGMTPAEFERDNKGKEHGPTCSLKRIFNHVPQYCQYCRLNFWGRHMTEETVKIHVRNCANNIRVSPLGQANLFQQLLTRSVGRTKLNGESRCHFSGCNQIFNPATTNLARANHFLSHIDSKDLEGRPCSFPNCDYDCTGLTQRQIMSHSKTHFDSSSLGRPTALHLCPFEDCEQDITGWTQQQVTEHMTNHLGQTGTHTPSVAPMCPYHNCSQSFTGLSREQIDLHLSTHHANTDCQWPGCDHRYAPDATDDDRRDHLRTHLPTNNIPSGTPVVVTQGTGSAGGNPPAQKEDENIIPKQLRDAHPGKNFYCPVCLVLVSGKNASPCKRHRKPPCKVQGHRKWLIMTSEEIQEAKIAKKNAPKARGKKTTAATEDPAYKPGEGSSNESEEDPATTGVKDPAGGKGNEKRKETTKDGAGDDARPSKKRKKK